MTTELTKAAQQALEVLKSATSFMSKKARDQHPKTVARLERALTTSQPAQAGEMDEREAFEAALTKMPAWAPEFEKHRAWVDVLLWQMWQACASLHTQPAAQATPKSGNILTDALNEVQALKQQATPEPCKDDVALALAAAQQSYPNPGEPEAGWCLLERKHVEALCRAAQQATPEPRLFIGACITDGRLHATVQRLESNGHVTLVATAEMDAASLHGHDCMAQMAPATPEPVPRSVFIAGNETAMCAFAARDLAERYVSNFGGATAGGMTVVELPVVGATPEPVGDVAGVFARDKYDVWHMLPPGSTRGTKLYTRPAPEPSINWFGTHFTYKNQPCDNVTCWRLGEAARNAKPGGDLIDHGLSLLHELEKHGYGVFALAAAQAKGGAA